jgi:hypothetical protein
MCGPSGWSESEKIMEFGTFRANRNARKRWNYGFEFCIANKLINHRGQTKRRLINFTFCSGNDVSSLRYHDDVLTAPEQAKAERVILSKAVFVRR